MWMTQGFEKEMNKRPNGIFVDELFHKHGMCYLSSQAEEKST